MAFAVFENVGVVRSLPRRRRTAARQRPDGDAADGTVFAPVVRIVER